MLNKILVAVDESAASQWAFDTALAMAQGLKSELLVVHTLDVFAPTSPDYPVIPAGNTTREMDAMAHKDYAQQWQALVEHYDALLKQKQAQAEAVGVKAYAMTPYGSPGPAICQTASDNDVDLIVIGNRNHTQLHRLVIGSVSSYILHHAPCSVTVVHSSQHRSLAEQPTLSREVTHNKVAPPSAV